MHELSIAMSIIDMACEEAEKHPGELVAIHLQLGPLAGVVPEALLSAFEMAREDSPLPSARLVVEHVPLVVWCSRCNAEREATSLQDFSCGTCGTPAAELRRGDELLVSALEFKT